MNNSTTTPAPEFDRLLEEFDRQWNSGAIPNIDLFYSRTDSQSDVRLYQFLIELVMIDMEYRWRRAQESGHDRESDDSSEPACRDVKLPDQPRLEDYVRCLSNLGSSNELPVELIADEYRVRHRWGDRPTIDEYLQRFKRQAGSIRDELREVARYLDEKQSMRQTDASIRCPHCHSSIRLEGADLSDVDCPSCGGHFSFRAGDDAPSIEAGVTQIGRFELLEQIGSGSFGTVWKARDMELDRNVAVKLPRHDRSALHETESFLREARAAAQLHHPNIVTVFEVGKEEGTVYIASDFISGNTLEETIRHRRFSARVAANLCASIADALQHAHDAGVIHRDLKPSNVMIDSVGQPHVMDFGLARREAGEVTLTMDGKVLGTPAYMPPEQAEGAAHDADRRSDVYSLGVILFELLTGERPFRGEVGTILHQVMNNDAPSLRKLTPHVPRDMETICLKCLEKEPSKRYQTSRELGEELRRYLDGRPIQARPIPRAARIWRWCRRNPLAATLGAVATSLLLAIGIAGPVIAVQKARSAERYRRLLYYSDMGVALQAWELGDVDRVCDLLRRHIPETGQADLRGFEWFHLWRLGESSRTRLFEFGSEVDVGEVAFSPDGATLAAAHKGPVTICDVVAGTKTRVLSAHSSYVTDLAFSPRDPHLLATTSWDGMKLWDLHNVAAPSILISDEFFATTVSFSPDGQLMATNGPNGEVIIWDVHQNKEMRRFDQASNVQSVAFAPDGRTVASGGDGSDPRVFLYNAQTGKTLAEFEGDGHTGRIATIKFSPDGRLLATGGRDNRIVLWDVQARSQVDTFTDHTGYVQCLSFSPDGTLLASASWDHTVKLWDVKTKRLRRTLRGHSGVVFSVAFTSKGDILASGSSDGKVKLWDRSQITSRDTLQGQRVAFTPDGTTLNTWSRDGTFRQWDVATGVKNRSIDCEAGVVAMAPNGLRMAIGRADGSVRLQDLATGRKRTLAMPHDSAVYYVAFSSTGKRLVSVSGHDLKLRRLDQSDVVANLRASHATHDGSAYSIAFARGDELLAVASEQESGTWQVDIYDQEGRHRTTLERRSGQIKAAVFSPDGRWLATAGVDNEIKIWDAMTLRRSMTIISLATPYALAFSPDNKRIAVGDGHGHITLWDHTTGNEIVTIQGHNRRIYSLAFSSDGKVLASGCEADVAKLWRAAADEDVHMASALE